MKIKDTFDNQMEFYQDRTGAIQLLFGRNSIRLEKWQVEALIGSNIYDIEDFDKDLYIKAYKSDRKKRKKVKKVVL